MEEGIGGLSNALNRLHDQFLTSQRPTQVPESSSQTPNQGSPVLLEAM